jgi:antitoxin component of MazEF toxin-antitoxin module
MFQRMLVAFRCNPKSLASSKIDGNARTMRPKRKRYELADLLADFDNTKKHAETDWGQPQGKEVW